MALHPGRSTSLPCRRARHRPSHCTHAEATPIGSERPAPAEGCTRSWKDRNAVTETQVADQAVVPDGWTDLDSRAVDTVRVLAADAVQKVGNGHPGTAMSLAPAAYLLFQKVMRHNPADTHWPGRDRFVLSCGHSSLTLYLQLYLGGFGLELDDLKALRTWDSKTPGHPEYGHTAGRRDHHRPARPGHRQRRRHGHGRPPRARPARPRRRTRASRPSTTRSTASPPTATSRRASAPRRPRSPAPSGWAT